MRNTILKLAILLSATTSVLAQKLRRVTTTDQNVSLRYLISPTGKWVAILSAAGPVIPPLVFSGDSVLGQRYHQVVSVPDAVSTGISIRIPVVHTDSTLRLCWSGDEKFVVYHDSSFSSLVVIETDLNSPNP